MKNALLIFLLLAATSPIFSQAKWLNEAPIPAKSLILEGTAPKKTDSSGLSLSETLNQVFDSVTALSPIKGFNAAMRLPDGSLWKRARGVAAEIPVSVPLTTEHLMGMGSITKSFTSVTLLLLYEEGLLDLGDSIGQYLPDFPNVPGHVTIRQLLGHRSGISDYLNENPAMLDDFFADVDKIWEPDSILNHYVLAPNFPVGADWSYSNTNYLLAGQIIESVTGQPWYVAVRQRLLEPLGLSHTFAYPYELPGSQPFSHLFADLNGDDIVDDWQGIGLGDAGLFSLANSAGNLLSTSEDLVRFSERVYGGHLLQAATLAELQTDYILNPAAGQYGLGTLSFPLSQNLENWGHNGDLIYKSIALYFPSEDMSLAVQQNDDRTFDPAAAVPVLDSDVLFGALVQAYLNFSPTSGIQEASPATDLVLFPNPAAQSIQLAFSENSGPQFPMPLILTDVNGKIVMFKLLENANDPILVGQLPTGVYGWRIGRYSGQVLKL